MKDLFLDEPAQVVRKSAMEVFELKHERFKCLKDGRRSKILEAHLTVSTVYKRFWLPVSETQHIQDTSAEIVQGYQHKR